MKTSLDTHTFIMNSKHKKYQAPLSPQLSEDDLVGSLDVLNHQPLTPSDSTELITPISPQSKDSPALQIDETLTMTKDEYPMQNDISLFIYLEFMDLIYWKIPGRSAIILSGILSSLILTRYYSLLYVCAASFTILTGFNLVFVNFYNLIRSVWTGLPTQELIHPYHFHIDQPNQNNISRELVEHYVHKSIDLLELIVQATAKIVYVQDSKMTGFACLLSGFIYFATSLISSKIFFGLFVLGIFTLPYYYREHQDMVDQKICSIVAKTKLLAEEYRVLARDQSIILYHQFVSFVQQQTIKSSDNVQQSAKKFN